MRFLILAAVFFAAGMLSAADLQPLLAPSVGMFWSRDAAALQKSAGVRFAWGTRDRKQIRYAAKKGTVSALKWLDHPVCEVLCELTGPEGKLRSMTVSVYNRGDGGFLPEGKFKQLRTRAEAAVAELAGPGVEPVRERMRMARETVYSRTWNGSEVRWQLLWCESDRGAEYLTLKAVHPSAPVEKMRRSVQAAVDRKALPDRVKKGADGSCYLEVPMIDQGDKGYCAAATVARVIRYYGGELDQNQAAQIIGTDAQFGTSCRELLKKLEREKSMLNIRPNMAYEFQDFSTVEGIRKFISRYNRAARSMRKPAIRLEDHVKNVRGGRVLDLDSLNKVVDPLVYRHLRLKDKDLPKFRREVQHMITRGLPILWMIPGHIRLIVGFDPVKDQIFYSDSWGRGHEMKKMPVQDAFVLTYRIFVLEPR